MLSAARDRLRREDGVTLIELMVTCLIGFVVLSAAAGLTESSGRSSARVTDEVEVAQRSRLAMEQVTRELRSQVCLTSVTPPIAEGRDDSITFYNDLDDDPDYRPERQRISFVTGGDGSLLQETWSGVLDGSDWTFPGEPRTRTLLTNVEAAPLFRYYSFDESELAAPLDTSVTAPVSSNSTARVVRVEVAFETLPTTGSFDSAERGTALSSSVYLRNTDHSDGDPAVTRTWGPRCA